MTEKNVLSFGCRLNHFEAEQIDHFLTELGRDDLLVLNSCVVTNEAERQLKQKIRQIARLHPEKTLAVVGCAAELHPQTYADMPEVSLVLGNAEKLEAKNYATASAEKIKTGGGDKKTSLDLAGFQTRTARSRANVMVQTGCDHDCTFCAITLARGQSRSVPIPELVAYIRGLVEEGALEVVLSGVDISAYGNDLPDQPNLGDLVGEILTEVPHLPRLRMSSIDCIELDSRLKSLMMSETRIVPHLHFSLQAGDDLILKRMKRRHTRQEAISLCQELHAKRPEIVFGADLIAGFPTETPEMFSRTLDLIDECPLTYLHVFPFSARDGTPAAKIPRQVSMGERKRRAKALRLKGERAMQGILHGLQGTEQEILLENQNFGRAANYAPVRLENPHSRASGLVKVRIIEVVGDQLIGRVCAPDTGTTREECAA